MGRRLTIASRVRAHHACVCTQHTSTIACTSSCIAPDEKASFVSPVSEELEGLESSGINLHWRRRLYEFLCRLQIAGMIDCSIVDCGEVQ